MNSHPRSWLDSLLGVCFTVLLAAVALTVAAHLLVAIWRVLAGAVAVIGVCLLGAAVVRHFIVRSHYW